MKCPHCRVNFHDNPMEVALWKDADGGWKLIKRQCPSCNKLILHLANGQAQDTLMTTNVAFYQVGDIVDTTVEKMILVWPRTSSRPPCPPEVPKNIAEDYAEACLVLSDSPKASAAMSRRCLQHILRDAAKVTPSDLAKEIQQVIDSRTLPSYIADALDTVRHTGNFAAHPLKSKASGEILPVEPGEAEWNLDVLELLFDFYYVQPAIFQQRKDELNRKLQEAGKKPMQ